MKIIHKLKSILNDYYQNAFCKDIHYLRRSFIVSAIFLITRQVYYFASIFNIQITSELKKNDAAFDLISIDVQSNFKEADWFLYLVLFIQVSIFLSIIVCIIEQQTQLRITSLRVYLSAVIKVYNYLFIYPFIALNMALISHSYIAIFNVLSTILYSNYIYHSNFI